MRNKGIVAFLTVVISLFCIYHLSFTWASMRIQAQATAQATDAQGSVDFAKRQRYLDKLYKTPVYNFLGIQHTYEEVKQNELALGLDLQGGMHVTLEVSPVELIRELSGRNSDKAFLEALADAERSASGSSFVNEFYKAYKVRDPKGNLSHLFALAKHKDYIDYASSDRQILQFIEREVDKAVDRSYDIITRRIDQFGTTQPNVQRLKNTRRIQLELPGVHRPERVRALLQEVAQLKFWQVYESETLTKSLQAVEASLIAKQRALTAKKPSSESNQGDGMAVPSLLSLRQKGYGLTYALEDVPTITRLLEQPEVRKQMPADLRWHWGSATRLTSDSVEAIELYPLKASRGGQAALEGEVVKEAHQTFDERGNPAVSMQMNTVGTKMWKRLTAENIGRRIAITLDDRVYSAPVVHTEIANGSSQITGQFTLEEARDLANVLRAGSLPAPVKIVEEAIIGPTLGKAAQTQGFTAVCVGLLLIMTFMGLYYARAGWIANLALGFNMLFILGALAQLHASLTLPGIAGIALTIGMSIDANVLVFERVREELKAGQPIASAIALGYDKAYSSIVDANITTFLTGAVLYSFGQGMVRGFATTLMIGIISSFFSAVLITRLIMQGFKQHASIRSLTFSFPWTCHWFSNCQIDFFKRRWIAYGISLTFIAVGMGLLIQQGGLNMGVDFTGGRSYVVEFEEAMEPSALKAKLAAYLSTGSSEVKTYGSSNVLKITTSHLADVNTSEADAQVQDTLMHGLQEITGASSVPDLPGKNSESQANSGKFSIVSAAKVGGTVAEDAQKSAQKAVVLSLAAIFLYILIRFRKWQFGLAAVAALLHDTLAVIAAFAVCKALGYSYEVDQVFIAAILTVIGYSINDTVVVFDRVREQSQKRLTVGYRELINRSINDTMSRTLITSLTTLMTVISLLIWGGEVMRGFSIALLVGIITGTYSSIFIAAPLSMDLSARERENI